MPAIVRAATAADLPQLLQLYRVLHPEDAPAPQGAALQAIWQELDSPRYRCVVAEQDGRLLSTCTLVIAANLTRGGRPYGWIENVVTDPAARGQGLGKAVLRHALDHAWARGCYKVMLMTGRRDAATLAFYAGAGFDAGAKQAFLARPEGV